MFYILLSTGSQHLDIATLGVAHGSSKQRGSTNIDDVTAHELSEDCYMTAFFSSSIMTCKCTLYGRNTEYCTIQKV